ncbi:hypothetical protein NEUTE2DRAFT_73730 [Neurospora tetrasperma FGSC 2509]|nr:hypothetical protein NEUTE2DRAFT_73730 [Neurospora tetrasperma FGSC 2509]
MATIPKYLNKALAILLPRDYNTLFHHPAFCNFPVAGQGVGRLSKRAVMSFFIMWPGHCLVYRQRPLGETPPGFLEKLLVLQVTLISGQKKQAPCSFQQPAAQHGTAPDIRPARGPVGAPFLALALAAIATRKAERRSL